MKATSMGADASLYIFDYEKYKNTIVPAFLRLLRDGSVEDPLLQSYEEYWRDNLGMEIPFPYATVFPRIDLLKYCTHLDEELGVRETLARAESLYDFGWEERTCASTSCPARSDCPFHRQTVHATSDVENLLWTLRRAVARQCLGEEQFLGRSVDCYFYWETLEELGVPEGHEIRVLLERLGRRGFLIGYKWVGGTDGIHGWLSPGETALLAQLLGTLELPNYECSFQAMEQEWAICNLLGSRGVGVEFVTEAHHHSTYPFERLSLSFVRTVCSLAAREGKGVLWGNDIP